MSNPLPAHGRIAGIDYGTKRIGIAISDPGRVIASPFENYTRRSPQADAEHFVRLVEQEDLVGFVVGLPLHMSGDESSKSREARVFGQWLGELTSLPICFHDERLSTSAAEQFLEQGNLTSKRRKARRDMLAAQVILASFLEADQSDRGGHGPLD